MRKSALFLAIFILVFSPIQIYHTAVVSAEPITAGVTLVYLAGLGLGAIGGYEAYQHRDDIAKGTEEFRTNVSELWEGQKVTGEFIWANLELGSQYFYKKLAEGVYDPAIESQLTAELISEIQANIQELNETQDLERQNEIFMQYELRKIQALSINNYINNPYPVTSSIEGYYNLNDSYHLKIKDDSVTQSFAKLGNLNELTNTSIKMVATNEIEGDFVYKHYYQSFSFNSNYYKIYWKVKGYNGYFTDYKFENESINGINVTFYKLKSAVNSTYDTMHYSSYYPSHSSEKITDNLNLLKDALISEGISSSYLDGILDFGGFQEVFNLGFTGSKVYPSILNTTVAFPNLSLEDLQSISNDDVQGFVVAIDDALVNDETVDVVIDYDGSNVKVGDVTVDENGNVDGGTTNPPINGELTETVNNIYNEINNGNNMDPNFDPTMIKDKFEEKLNLGALKNALERLNNINTEKGAPPVIYLNLNKLFNAGTSEINPNVQNPFANEDTVFIDFGILETFTFGGYSLVDYFRTLIAAGFIWTTLLYVWGKIVPNKVVSR